VAVGWGHHNQEVPRWRGVTDLNLLILGSAIATTDWVVERALPHVAGDVAKVLALAMFLAFGYWILELSDSELGLARRDVRRGVVVGMGAAGVIIVVIAALVFVPASRSHFLDSRVARDSWSQHWLVPLLGIPLGTAVFEEIIFRGVLLGAACRRWRLPGAVAVTSVAFGLWHIPVATSDATTSHSPAALVGTFVVTTLAGVLFALLRLRSGSVVAPILAHIATNSGAYAAALVALRLWG